MRLIKWDYIPGDEADICMLVEVPVSPSCSRPADPHKEMMVRMYEGQWISVPNCVVLDGDQSRFSVFARRIRLGYEDNVHIHGLDWKNWAWKPKRY